MNADTIESIVRAAIIAAGGDGLSDGNGCGCHLDDLACCGAFQGECYPAKWRPCTEEEAIKSDGAEPGEPLAFPIDLDGQRPVVRLEAP